VNHFQRQSVINSVDGNIQAWLQDKESNRNYYSIQDDAQFKPCKVCEKQIPWNQDYCRKCWLELKGINLPII
jgi:hypothetical protein